ncbi:hypothetical protein FRC10_001557 [Ceratobasidium sp. 414]|nr:hypothetical protein FRC10_001557 [Ceratobasidium sp. 414]
MACCFAGDGASLIFDSTENKRLPPQVILMASSQAGQPSYASLPGDDHFLNAFFKTLKVVARHENCQSWEYFMALIQAKLDRRRGVFPDGFLEKREPLVMKNMNIVTQGRPPAKCSATYLGLLPVGM